MGNLKIWIRKVLFSKFNDKTIERFYKIYYRLRYPNEMSRSYSFGIINPTVVFYVIRPRTDCTEGLMSLFMNVAKNMYFAKEQGYEPIIDFENYRTQYDDEAIGNRNTWEMYFTQPTHIALDEVYRTKNVILSGLEIQWYRPGLFEKNFSDSALRKLHSSIFSTITFSKNVQDAVEQEISILKLTCEQTLAVYLRGTDYIALKPSGHPVQPTVEQAIAVIDEYLNRYSLDKIFLVTEDGNIYNKIKERYTEKCIVVSYDSFINDYKGKNFLSHDRSIKELSASPYQRGLNYLVKLIILSKCACFVGGNTMGSWAACTFSAENFKAKYVFDLGVYGK